jgi:hypothetical protein
VESLRIDPANEIAGLRVNQWMAILAIIGGVAYTAWAIRRDGVTSQHEPPSRRLSHLGGHEPTTDVT